MGILNVTPDSFADGGKHFTFEHAVQRGLEMIEEGVDIIDIGGESTRPGAERVSAEEEQRRVIPVIKALAGKGTDISVDTMRASTAKLAVEAGATIVNDVSGGAADEEMFSTVAQLGCNYTLRIAVFVFRIDHMRHKPIAIGHQQFVLNHSNILIYVSVS